MNDRSSRSAWEAHPLLRGNRVDFLDAPMHMITMEDTIALACEAMTTKTPLHQTVVNVAKLVNSARISR